MSASYIIRNLSTTRYLEWNPALQEWSWLAAFPQHATLLTKEAAEAWIAAHPEYRTVLQEVPGPFLDIKPIVIVAPRQIVRNADGIDVMENAGYQRHQKATDERGIYVTKVSAEDCAGDTVIVNPSGEYCEYCYPEHRVILVEDEPYQLAHCPRCEARHGWNDETAHWFGC